MCGNFFKHQEFLKDLKLFVSLVSYIYRFGISHRGAVDGHCICSEFTYYLWFVSPIYFETNTVLSGWMQSDSYQSNIWKDTRIGRNVRTVKKWMIMGHLLTPLLLLFHIEKSNFDLNCISLRTFSSPVPFNNGKTFPFVLGKCWRVESTCQFRNLKIKNNIIREHKHWAYHIFNIRMNHALWANVCVRL